MTRMFHEQIRVAPVAAQRFYVNRLSRLTQLSHHILSYRKGFFLPKASMSGSRTHTDTQDIQVELIQKGVT